MEGFVFVVVIAHHFFLGFFGQFPAVKLSARADANEAYGIGGPGACKFSERILKYLHRRADIVWVFLGYGHEVGAHLTGVLALKDAPFTIRGKVE